MLTVCLTDSDDAIPSRQKLRDSNSPACPKFEHVDNVAEYDLGSYILGPGHGCYLIFWRRLNLFHTSEFMNIMRRRCYRL